MYNIFYSCMNACMHVINYVFPIYVSGKSLVVLLQLTYVLYCPLGYCKQFKPEIYDV